ncbi:43kDa postsynaptic protein [Trema orientale]|uniref:RING-type E3 ubiquitin transferase n=1 Tax=Trema orientale TaxID=63057 RepID=A0A2P5DD57_TREOI|nr:43kDa postsynaptic protein [Trema orientale]
MKATSTSNRKLLILNDDAPFISRYSPSPPPPAHLVTMDSSMVLLILVLSTALLSVFFFCFYLCRPNRSTPPPRAPPAATDSPKGLHPSVVRSLPVSSYGGAAPHRVVDCAICLVEFGENDVVKVMPFCGHVFHPLCIDTWLSSHVSCPVCRSTRVSNLGT